MREVPDETLMKRKLFQSVFPHCALVKTIFFIQTLSSLKKNIKRKKQPILYRNNE